MLCVIETFQSLNSSNIVLLLFFYFFSFYTISSYSHIHSWFSSKRNVQIEHVYCLSVQCFVFYKIFVTVLFIYYYIYNLMRKGRIFLQLNFPRLFYAMLCPNYNFVYFCSAFAPHSFPTHRHTFLPLRCESDLLCLMR